MGCSFWNTPYNQQLDEKKSDLLKQLSGLNLNNLPEVKIHSLAPYELRHRFDFTIHDGKFGLYDQNKKILDLESCLQLAPKLNSIYQEFKNLTQEKFVRLIKKGSVRIRVSPNQDKGLWLDFSNLDIKSLLDEKELLRSLLTAGFHIEYGQRNKRIMLQDNLPKVSDPKPFPWFQTYTQQEKPLQLNGYISSFTQPSWLTAKKILEIIFSWISTFSQPLKIAEFGSGLGQYTLPLLALGHHLDAYEWDLSACENLNLNCKENHLTTHNLKIFNDDFHHQDIHEKSYDLVLVNPARSGLKNFAEQILKTRPNQIIYVSCFPESLHLDLKSFLRQGLYQISDLHIVDQFPQTKHYEACVLLSAT